MRDQLFEGLRRTWREGCSHAASALEAAPAAFMPQAQLFEAAVQAAAGAVEGSVAEAQRAGRGICHEMLLRQQQAPAYPALGPQCPLLARKFQEHTIRVGGWVECGRSAWNRLVQGSFVCLHAYAGRRMCGSHMCKLRR